MTVTRPEKSSLLAEAEQLLGTARMALSDQRWVDAAAHGIVALVVLELARSAPTAVSEPLPEPLSNPALVDYGETR